MFSKSCLAILTVFVVLMLFGVMSISGAFASPSVPATAISTGGDAVTSWNASVPSGSPLDTVNTHTNVYFNPNTSDIVSGTTLKAGGKWYIVGVVGNFYKISLVNSYVYVQKSVVTTNWRIVSVLFVVFIFKDASQIWRIFCFPCFLASLFNHGQCP